MRLFSEREIRKHEARKQGAQVIIDQIQERTQIRLKEQEIRDKERVELLKNIERMRKEDEAGRLFIIPYLLSAFLTPILGPSSVCP